MSTDKFALIQHWLSTLDIENMSCSFQHEYQEQEEQLSKKPIRYHHGYTPIKPIRQLIKHTYCFTILSNVECQIETLKTNRSMGTMIVKEIFRFRFDEDKIWVYKCDKPLPFSIDQMPQCHFDSPCYSHDSLPEKYWHKYNNACRFMNIVRSKLPMITYYTDEAKAVLFDTYYTDEAKAVLFDTSSLFEVVFFADSTRFIYNGNSIRMVKNTGEELEFSNNKPVSITADIKPLIQKVSEMFKIVNRENYPKIFPKVIGQKPRKQTKHY